MNTIATTTVFDRWLTRLKDHKGKARIIERIRSLERGHIGDCSTVGRGVVELRVHFGPGYRIYVSRVGTDQYVLLCGGTKQSQQGDIRKAQEMARHLRRK